MKKQTALVIAASLITAASFAQKKKQDDIPAVVKSSFQKQYPSVKEVEWEKEGANYEANFDVDKKETSVVLNSQGSIIETEVEIAVNELPKEATDYLSKHYSKEKVKEAAKITDAKGAVTYEAEVKGMDVLFDNNGKFITTQKD